MALMGDSIDNIPGAKGIGEKGARELIQRFGSVEAALERAAEVEGKRYREALQTQADQVRLSKKLATIACDAPVPLELDVMKRQPPDMEALRALYSELGFSSLLKELGPAASTEKTDYELFNSPAELRKFLKTTAKDQEIALWLAAGFRRARRGRLRQQDDSDRAFRSARHRPRRRGGRFGQSARRPARMALRSKTPENRSRS